MQKKKREGPVDLRYESMPDKDFFSLFKDEYSYSGIGLNMEKNLKEKPQEEMQDEWRDFAKRVFHISDEKAARLVKYMTDYVYGGHVLTYLMGDKNVSDIKALSWNNIWIKKLGIRSRADTRFESPEDFKTFVEMVAVRNGINLGNANAIRTFVDKETSPENILRFTAHTGLVNDSKNPTLHIRKSSKEKKTMDVLITEGLLNKKIADYLQSRMLQGYLLISGGNGCGKTTLTNALLDKYPLEDSVLVVQENEELTGGEFENKMFQHTVVGKGDQSVNYRLKELVIWAQMIDIDHIVIGEIKGEEALYFITAALTGCKGMATIHSENAKGALEKMSDYCKWASDYSRTEIMKLLSCVKTIVYIENYKVHEIAINQGFDEETGENRLEIVYDRKREVDRL